MAELTKAQLEAAEERASNHSLGDDDVVLQTSDTMPEGVGVKGTTIETAGTEAHGPIFSFTRNEVRTALERWPQQGRSSGTGGRRRAGNGRRRATREGASSGGRRSRAAADTSQAQTDTSQGSGKPE